MREVNKIGITSIGDSERSYKCTECGEISSDPIYCDCIVCKGKSKKRFKAACFAMQGILSTEYSKDISNNLIVKMAYMLADELLKQGENE